MNPTIRRIAVSGSAAVALLSGAAATASATVTDEHQATVIAIAKTDVNDPAGVTNGLTPDNGSGAQLQNPVNGTPPAGVTGEQIQTQASGGVVAGGVVAILVLGIIVVVRVRGKDVKVGDAVVLTLFGIAVSGTVVGALGDQLTDSAISSLGSMLGGL
jgi:hypothetical protein